jgi:hypothetical protein
LVARASPIRDKICVFLSEPRAAREVARHIDRPVPVATGHLAAMCRLGLAKRIGANAYAAANYSGPPLCFKRLHHLTPLRLELRRHLSVRSTPVGLRCKTGAQIKDIRAVLKEMWLSGAIVGDDERGYVFKHLTE